MSSLIQKITIKHKLNHLYRDIKDEYLHIVEASDSRKVSATSAQFSFSGLINYATSRYNHICEINGVQNANIYDDKRFETLFSNIERRVSELNADLMQQQIKLGAKDNWKDTKENDACLNHLTETFGSKK